MTLALLDQRYPERRRHRRGRGIDDSRRETFTRRDIFDRDRWTCRRCGESVDSKLPTTNRLAATIDYCDPDGPHSCGNVQLAHRECNYRHHYYDQVYRDGRGNRELRGLDALPTERFTVRYVGLRDRWICQLCQQPVSPEPMRPLDSLQAASIDHKDEQGPHTMDNVQLTHICCNNFRDHIRWSEWADEKFNAEEYAAVLTHRVANAGRPLRMKRLWSEVLPRRHPVLQARTERGLPPVPD